MTTDPVIATDLAQLRREELARREERRRAREKGAVPALRARRREALSRVGGPASPDMPDEESVAPTAESGTTADLPPLSPRILAALERAAVEANDSGFVEAALLRAAPAPDPQVALAHEVRELLSRVAPLRALTHLVELAAGGLPVLGASDLGRAESLCGGCPPEPAVDPQHVDAWQLHLEAAAAAGYAELPLTVWQRLAERLPLPVVDDLIDGGALQRSLAPHTWSERTQRVRYIIARLSPERLEDPEVVELEWEDEECRRILRSGGGVLPIEGRHDEWSLRSALLGGELDALDEIAPRVDRLPAALADLVMSLQEVRRGSPVGPRLGQDFSLFGLLEDCLPEARLISGSTAFHYWAGTRRMYRLLDDVHWSLACEPDRLPETARATLQQALALRSAGAWGSAARADREARVVQAYLYFLHSGPKDRDRLDQGIGLLEEVLKRGGSRRGGVGGEQRRRMRELSELLQSLRSKSKPQEVLNPYLALCVEHGSTEWRQGWRDLRNQVGTGQLEYINGAKDRIKRSETARRLGNESEALYAVPLDERFLWVPDARNDVLQPGPRPLERRTLASSEEERQWAATEAARELIGRCVTGTRNDH
ncbi:hypothetical protein [Streptomyces sp. CS149]|uniref:hypothetical protein n=1 Tax=Streptomyces sp. CS149 TaxID=2109332 RepID=UPI00131ED5F2|nr:hypothetical protein [Streptomyces sp. CS149]